MLEAIGAVEKRVFGRNQKLVLEALKSSARPMRAYELLALLQEKGFRSPTQVYRALDRLIEEKSVHKIESISAYAPRAQDVPGSGRHVMFAICANCGQANEVHDGALGRALQRLASRLHLQATAATVELTGLCEVCSDE
jgi:Fur family zinc uptake transcriptional regulator